MKQVTYLVLLIFVIAFLSACQSRSEKRAEKFTEKMLEKSFGENVDVDVDGESITIHTNAGKIIASTGKKKWPKEIPSSVPKFNYGNIENVSLRELPDGNIWAMVFENVPKDVLTTYESLLKKNGFDTSLIGRPNVGGMLQGEKNELNVMVMAGEGDASLTVTINKE